MMLQFSKELNVRKVDLAGRQISDAVENTLVNTRDLQDLTIDGLQERVNALRREADQSARAANQSAIEDQDA